MYMYLKYYKKTTDTVVHDLKIHGKRTQLKKDTVLGAGTKFSTSKYLSVVDNIFSVVDNIF